jgi:DNA-binding winged helix-turn-helix (wHTH) protein
MISMKTRSESLRMPCGNVEVLRSDRPTSTGQKPKGKCADGPMCAQTDNSPVAGLQIGPVRLNGPVRSNLWCESFSMASVTVLVPLSVDFVLKKAAASRGSSVDNLVNDALTEYLEINYSCAGGMPTDCYPPEACIRVGEIELDPARRIVRKAGRVIQLTPKEFELLRYLMRNAGFPIAHFRLLRAIWGAEYGNESEYLRTYIRQLRKKLEDEPAEPKYLLTERWFGYRMVGVVDSGHA